MQACWLQLGGQQAMSCNEGSEAGRGLVRGQDLQGVQDLGHVLLHKGLALSREQALGADGLQQQRAWLSCSPG